MAENVIKCVYSGDKDDEFCSGCDGIMMNVGKDKIPATECEGYTMEATSDPVIVKPPKAKPPKAKPAKLTAVPEQDPAVEQEVADTGAQTSEIGEIDTSPIEVEDYTVLGMTTVIRAESGVTIETKNSKGQSHWYKFGYTEERIIPASADIGLEREALWADAHREVDTQVQEVMKLLNT